MTSSSHRRGSNCSLSDRDDGEDDARRPFDVDIGKINDTKEIRIIIVGKTGVGKSATGNTILGTSDFDSFISGSSVTQRGRIRMMKWNNIIVHVIDTPGFFDTETSPEKVLVEIIKSCGMVSPGPHVILYVISTRSRFTKEDEKAVDEFINLFTGDPYKHMIICFTEKDALERERKSEVEYLQDIPEPLTNFVKKCGKRTVFFNNISQNSIGQWNRLYNVINTMLTQNNESFYSNEILEAVEKALHQKMKEDRNPSEVMRWIYKAKRDIENDGTIVGYLKTTLMGATIGATLATLAAFAVELITGKTAIIGVSVVGGVLFSAGKKFITKK